MDGTSSFGWYGGGLANGFFSDVSPISKRYGTRLGTDGGLSRTNQSYTTTPQPRSSAGARLALPAVFVDADELPGAYRPQGQYEVKGKQVIIRLTLLKDRQRIQSLTLEGTIDTLPSLAERLAGALVEIAQEKGK